MKNNNIFSKNYKKYRIIKIRIFSIQKFICLISKNFEYIFFFIFQKLIPFIQFQQASEIFSNFLGIKKKLGKTVTYLFLSTYFHISLFFNINL